MIYITDLKSSNVDGKCVGHYFAFADNYLAIFQDSAHAVVAGGPVYKSRYKENLVSLPCDGIENSGKLKIAIGIIKNCIYLSKIVRKGDSVILQQSQPAMLLFAIFIAYWSKANLYMVQYNAEPMKRMYFRLLMFLTKWKIKGLICPSDVVGAAYKVPYCVVPDYIYVENSDSTYLPKNKCKDWVSKKFDFCLVGRLNDDKGVIEACKKIKNTSYSFIVAGRPDDEIYGEKLKKICDGTDNITLILDYVPNDLYSKILEESRYALMNYQGDYANRSSGVVLDTIFAGVPVVGCRCNALKFVEEHGMGFLYDKIDDFNLAEVVNEVFYRKSLVAIEQYMKSHTKFKEQLKEFVLCK